MKTVFYSLTKNLLHKVNLSFSAFESRYEISFFFLLFGAYRATYTLILIYF